MKDQRALWVAEVVRLRVVDLPGFWFLCDCPLTGITAGKHAAVE